MVVPDPARLERAAIAELSGKAGSDAVLAAESEASAGGGTRSTVPDVRFARLRTLRGASGKGGR
jgi:hypothetical protein